MEQILQTVNQVALARKVNVYLVGGFLRDKLLGRESGDVDLVVEGPAKPLAQEITRRLSGTLVTLDEKRGIYRVVVPVSGSFIQMDLEEVGEGGLIADLKRRDFTINALALPLAAYLTGSPLEDCVIDVMGGIKDLRWGIIRACGPASMEDDPVRALRAFRFAATTGFTPDPGTLELIRKMRRPVTVCAGERIWDELAAVFRLNSARVIRLMDCETDLIKQIIPGTIPLRGMEQGGRHVDDVWEHSLKTLEAFEDIVNILGSRAKGAPSDNLADNLAGYLGEHITRLRTRLPVLKLGCLLHDAGKQFCREYAGGGRYTFYGHHHAGVPVAGEVAGRLKLSGREREALEKLVELHMDPLFLYRSGTVTPRALRRFFRRAEPETPGVLLLSMADITSTRSASGKTGESAAYREFIFDLLARYFSEGYFYLKPPKLLNGNDICSILNIKPSPLAGQVLDALADAQADGTVRSREEAEDFIRWLRPDLDR